MRADSSVAIARVNLPGVACNAEALHAGRVSRVPQLRLE